MPLTKITRGALTADIIDSTKLEDNAVDTDHLAADAVENAKIADNAADTAEIADNAVTLAKMAGLARGKIIYGDASGDPAALALGTDNHVLTVNGSDINWEAATSPAITTSSNADSTTNSVVLYNGTGATSVDSSGNLTFDGSTLTVTGDGVVTDDLTLNSDSAVFNMGAGNDFTMTHDGTTGVTLAATPISINSTGDLTLDSTTDIVLDAAGGNFEFKDAGTTQLTIDVDGTAGDIDVNLNVDGDDLVFNQYDGTEVMRITDTGTVGIGTRSGDSEDTLLHLDSAGDAAIITMSEGGIGGQIHGANGGDGGRLQLSTEDSGGTMQVRMSFDGKGHCTMPFQPAFLAYRAATNQSISSGTWTTCIFNTERFDIGSNYNTSTGIFTAPETGKYQINCTARIDGLSHAAAHASVQINTSNTNYMYQALITPTSHDSTLNYHSLNLACLIDMDANDTALISAYFSGSTGRLAAYTGCTFSGFLVS
jgi:hypothetical protein